MRGKRVSARVGSGMLPPRSRAGVSADSLRLQGAEAPDPLLLGGVV